MEVVELCLPQQRSFRRRGAAVGEVTLVLGRTGQVHQPRQQIRGSHTVGQRVVRLADQRETVLGHPLREVKLPEGPGAVQRGTGDLADELVELAPFAGTGHLHAPEVIVEIDVAILRPHWVVQMPRNVDEPVSQRVQQMQSALDGPPEHVEVEFAIEVCGVDDCHLQRVGVQIGCLAVQEHGVHAIESLHSPPRLDRLPLLPSKHLSRRVDRFSAWRSVSVKRVLMAGECNSRL